MPGRNEYTKSDQNFLTQYIAKYNPLPAGRLGNKLYFRLLENEGNKWPWAKRHTWSSWREHYKQNQQSFDHQIKMIQERVALSQRQEAEEQMEGGSKATQVKVEVKKPTKRVKLPNEKRVEDKGEGTSRGPQANTLPSKPSKPKPIPTSKALTSAQAKPRSKATSGEDRSEAAKPFEKPRSNGNGNASTDSGYASTTKLPLKDTSTAKMSTSTSTTIQAARPPSKTSSANATKEQKPPPRAILADGSLMVTSRQASETAPTRPIKVDKKREEEVVEDSQAEDDSNSNNDSEDDGETEDDSDTEHEKELVGEDSYMHELFGSFEEEEEDTEDAPSEHPAASVPSSPLYEPIYPKISDLPEPAASEPVIPGAFDPPRPSKPSQAPTPPKSNGAGQSSPAGHASKVPHLPISVHRSPPVKKHLKRKHAEDEDPFTSATSSQASPVPSKPANVVTQGRPPTLTEGAFRNTFVPPRSRFEDEDDEVEAKSWPPKRRKKNFEQKDDVQMADATNAAQAPIPAPSRKPKSISKASKPKAPVSVPQPQIPLGLLPPVPQHTRPLPPPQYANAVASSSKLKLPPSNAVPSVNHILPPSNVLESTAKSKKLLANKRLTQTTPPQDFPAIKKRKIDHTPHPPTKPSFLSIPVPVAKPQEPRKPPEKTPMAADMDVFFNSHSLAINKGKSRASGESSHQDKVTGRHVDLREEMMKHRMSKNSTSLETSLSRESSFSRSGAKSRKLPPRRLDDLEAWRLSAAASIIPFDNSTSTSLSTMPSSDAHLMSLFKREITTLAENYGFAAHVVEKIYKKLKALDKTKEVLKKMESDLKDYVETLKGDHDVEARSSGESEGVPEGVIPKEIKEAEVVTKKKTRVYVGKTPPPRPYVQPVTVVSRQRMVSRARPSLDYKPLPPDAAELQEEYSPPAKTRAGRFIKLQREGREEEAKMALASSGRSLRKGRASSVAGLRQPHPLMTMNEFEASPTPRRREESVRMDVDEDEHQEAVEDDREVAEDEVEVLALSEVAEDGSGSNNRRQSQLVEGASFEEDENEVANEIIAEDEDFNQPPLAEVDEDDGTDIYASSSPWASPAPRHALEHSDNHSAGEQEQVGLRRLSSPYSSPARQPGNEQRAHSLSEVILAQDSYGEQDEVDYPFQSLLCSKQDILAWVHQQVEEALDAQKWRKSQVAGQ